jgi:hypothetical protein
MIPMSKRNVKRLEKSRNKPAFAANQAPLTALENIDGLAEDANKRLLEWLKENAFQYCYDGDLEELRDVLKAIDTLVCIRSEVAAAVGAGAQ